MPCQGDNWDDGPQCVKKNSNAYDRTRYPYHYGDDPSKLHISDSGLQFIQDWEAFAPYLYNDDGQPSSSSQGNCTIGYGSMLHNGPCGVGSQADLDTEKQYQNGITEQRANELLKADVAVAEGIIQGYVTVPLKQQEYDALVSFAFNIGEGQFSTSNVLEDVNNRNFNAVPGDLNQWIFPLWATGLVQRRNQEGMIFVNGNYNSAH